LAQDAQQRDLPLGSRGGGMVRHYFPVSGEYELQILTRGVSRFGTEWPEQATVAIDGTLVDTFTLEKTGKHILRVPVVAGTRQIVVTFPDVSNAVVNQLLEPYDRPLPQYALGLGPLPTVKGLTIAGPFNGVGDSAALKALAVCRPTTAASERPCA